MYVEHVTDNLTKKKLDLMCRTKIIVTIREVKILGYFKHLILYFELLTLKM